MAITEGLCNSVKKLEQSTVVEIPAQVLPEVADVTAAAAKMRVKIDSMDKVLGEIINKKKI